MILTNRVALIATLAFAFAAPSFAYSGNALSVRLVSEISAPDVDCPDFATDILTTVNSAVGYQAHQDADCFAMPLGAEASVQVLNMYLENLDVRMVRDWESGPVSGLDFWDVPVVWVGQRYSLFVMSSIGARDFALVMSTRYVDLTGQP